MYGRKEDGDGREGEKERQMLTEKRSVSVKKRAGGGGGGGGREREGVDSERGGRLAAERKIMIDKNE